MSAMPLDLGPVLMLLAVMAVAAFAVWLHFEEQKRRRLRNLALGQVGERLGMRVTPFGYRSEHPIFDVAAQLKKGHSRYAENILRGDSRHRDVTLFDYNYAITTSNGKTSSTRHYHLTCATVELPCRTPWLTVFAEGLDSKLAQFFGYDDIDFESKRFSDAYCVRSGDKRFAYDVVTPAMMEYLLARPGLYFEIAQGVLVIAHHERLDPSDYEAFLGRALRLRELIPDRLFESRP